MNKNHGGFWLATLGLGICWQLALLAGDRLNGILLAGAVLALIFTSAPRRKGAMLTAIGGIGMDGLWSYSGVLHYSEHVGLPLWTFALWLGFGCWWYWLLDRVRAAPWPLAVLGAVVGPFAYALCWKMGALRPGIPPEIMLLLLSVGWAIYLPAVSWLQLRKDAAS